MNGVFIEIKKLSKVMPQYWIAAFFILTILYMELIYSLWCFKSINMDILFPLLFGITVAVFLSILSSIFNQKVNGIISLVVTALLTLLYSFQLVYFSIFRMPFSVCSLAAADDVLQFKSIIYDAIFVNLIGIILLLFPIICLFILNKHKEIKRAEKLPLIVGLLVCICIHTITIAFVNMTGDSNVSQRTLYYKFSTPELSIRKLGVFTTVRLDIKNYLFLDNKDPSNNATNDTDIPSDEEYNTTAGQVWESTVASAHGTGQQETTTVDNTMIIEDNALDINFEELISKEKDSTILDMHKYFSQVTPTQKNKYTGLFKGNNLILITAESFSPYAISPELTPILYKMSTEGFVFKNFYNPVWRVSTSDGEYVACTSLIPKAGVWSFAKSAVNYLPFVFGNQFSKIGYGTKAYHNHTYTYYKRDISHPNMGYEFKAVGNGLDIKKSWPESDLDMIKATVPEYIGPQPFHTYYMTVSGHMNYNFFGNYIASKNKEYVKDLPYSEEGRAYIACNLELEFALKELIDSLETAGIADNTVIAISPDHYPYGLPKENIDELAGHEVESNFELYKSTFIIWKKGLETVQVERPCSSLDINPTLSNLFGLEYDSRLLMGTDVLSNSSPLVVFSNKSWITDRAIYNSVTDTVIFNDGDEMDNSYAKMIDKKIADMFDYSTKVLESDYYSRVIPKP